MMPCSCPDRACLYPNSSMCRKAETTILPEDNMTPRTVKTSELRIADVVAQRLNGGNPWSTCIVTQIKDGEVHLFRPYGHTADFSYTGGVISYTGIETYKVEVDRSIEWTLYERKELR